MIFHTFTLSRDEAIINATAQGHADAVVDAFRAACSVVFTGQGAWRITRVRGQCFPEMVLDSDMEWSLQAERKVDHQFRTDQNMGMTPGRTSEDKWNHHMHHYPLCTDQNMGMTPGRTSEDKRNHHMQHYPHCLYCNPIKVTLHINIESAPEKMI